MTPEQRGKLLDEAVAHLMMVDHEKVCKVAATGISLILANLPFVPTHRREPTDMALSMMLAGLPEEVGELLMSAVLGQEVTLNDLSE